MAAGVVRDSRVRRVVEINAAGGETFDRLKAGDEVTVQDGPFLGYDANFDTRLPGDARVQVLIEVLEQQADSIRTIGQPASSQKQWLFFARKG